MQAQPWPPRLDRRPVCVWHAFCFKCGLLLRSSLLHHPQTAPPLLTKHIKGEQEKECLGARDAKKGN